MKVTEIAITRKFNIGNYQTVDIHVRASVDQNEDPIQSIAALEKIINDYWSDRTDKLVSLAKKQ
jgi:predicted Zn-dependent protease with MMP-like domain